ncbi:MAG: PorP/SprF family type IX secretion system membrane protein, partial [Bacteroidota bacterium]|nr:PorP/SprF family type IX secretion system membrane protein [Bacteroidota bacterium]
MNRIIKKATIVLTVLCLTAKLVHAQDVTFSQFLYSPSYYNPAATGIDVGLLGTINYRRALIYLPSKFETYAVGLDQSIHDTDIKGIGGVGLFLVNNQEGEGNLNTLSFGVPFSGRVDLTDQWTLQAGIAPVIYQKTINWDHLIFGDQLNPYYGIVIPQSEVTLQNAVPSISFFDFDIGLWGRWESDPTHQSNVFDDVFDIGVSIQHVPEPNQSFFMEKSKLPSKYVLMARYSHAISDYRMIDSKIQPVVLLEKQGTMQDFVVGVNYTRPGINFGGFIRREQNSILNFSEFIFLTGIDVNLNSDMLSTVRLNYSVDVTVTSNKKKGNLSHEVSLIFHLPSIHRA